MCVKNAEFWLSKISFYKFIKENSKFPFITGVPDFIAGIIFHSNLYYNSQENFSLSQPSFFLRKNNSL